MKKPTSPRKSPSKFYAAKMLTLVSSMAVMTDASLALANPMLSDDSFIKNQVASSKNGASASLLVANASTKMQSVGYLKFKVPAGFTVQKATVKIFASKATGNAAGKKLRLFDVNLANWNETSSNSPVPAQELAAASVRGQMNQWVEFDVTGHVKDLTAESTNTQELGFALKIDEGLSVLIDSKENKATSHQAELDIVWVTNASSGATGETGAPGATGATGVAGTIHISTATTSDLNGLLKADGSTVAEAVDGTDYLSPTGDGSGLTGVGSTGITVGGGTALAKINHGLATLNALVTVPKATATYTGSMGPCAGGGCVSNISALGTITGILTATGCTDNASAQRLMVTPQNLPANVWMQNAVCTGLDTATLTFVTAKTNAATDIPTTTAFDFLVIK